MSIVFPQYDENTFQPQRLIMQYVRSNRPVDIYMKIKEKVMAQDAAIRQASILIYSYLKTLAQGNYDDYKYHFMIEAESGCGKSTFANALKTAVQIPVVICDASQITGAGWRGCDATDLLDNDELWKWGSGIIILDELDKAIMPQGGNAENHHRFVQESFLKMMDGGIVNNRDGKAFDCSRYLFIGMGAFAPMRETNVERRSIGFETAQTAASTKKTELITRDRITEICGSEQFMGRMVSILHFQRLGWKHYKAMMENVVEEICSMYGSWDLPEEAKDSILRKAIESPYGARNIRNQVWEWFIATDSIMMREMKRQEAIDCKLREGLFPDEEDRDFLYRKLLASEGAISA